MPEKPSTLPTWATTGGTTLEPSSGQKAAGFAVGTKPPARWMNWLLKNLADWIGYVNAPVGTGAGAGFSATGGSTSGTGLVGTGGATNGKGVSGVGDGTGSGVEGLGGDGSGAGVNGTGGATNGVGVSGTGTGNGAGVVGFSGTPASWPYYSGVVGSSAAGFGVYGITDANDIAGVYGVCTGANSTLQAAAGVRGYGDVSAYGVIAESDDSSPKHAALRIVPQNAAPTGPNAVGDVYVTTAGKLYICTSAGTPGTWTLVGSQT